MSVNASPRRKITPRPDYHLIGELVPAGSRVLDLGCGDGQLLALLASTKGCAVRGIEIDERAVRECVARGVPVYHGDMLEGLSFYRDSSFDTVILSQTLQQASDPRRVIHEMLRVGQRGIISFPNFGHWVTRLQLLLSGHMPRNRLLPYTWFETPNVHLCTVRDFRDLCDAEGLVRVSEIYLSPRYRPIPAPLANLFAGLAIFQVQRNQRSAPARRDPAG